MIIVLIFVGCFMASEYKARLKTKNKKCGRTKKTLSSKKQPIKKGSTANSGPARKNSSIKPIPVSGDREAGSVQVKVQPRIEPKQAYV